MRWNPATIHTSHESAFHIRLRKTWVPDLNFLVDHHLPHNGHKVAIPAFPMLRQTHTARGMFIIFIYIYIMILLIIIYIVYIYIVYIYCIYIYIYCIYILYIYIYILYIYIYIYILYIYIKYIYIYIYILYIYILYIYYIIYIYIYIVYVHRFVVLIYTRHLSDPWPLKSSSILLLQALDVASLAAWHANLDRWLNHKPAFCISLWFSMIFLHPMIHSLG